MPKRKKVKDENGPRDSKYALKKRARQAGYDYSEGYDREQMARNWAGVPVQQRLAVARAETASAQDRRSQGFTEPYVLPKRNYREDL